jgi:hypothetical protein
MPFRARAAVGLSLALFAAAPTFGGAAAPPDATAVRSVLLRQASLLKQGKWRAMYATYTPRFRTRCPYALFVRGSQQTRRFLGPNFRVDRIVVRVQPGGRRALAGYRFLRNGRAIVTVRLSDGDAYAKIGSRWLDDYDRVSAC